MKLQLFKTKHNNKNSRKKTMKIDLHRLKLMYLSQLSLVWELLNKENFTELKHRDKKNCDKLRLRSNREMMQMG